MAEAAADQRVVAQPNKKRQPGLKISIHGGGGILIIGGALIAALLFRRSRANKRRPLPPPPPPSESDQAEPVEAKGITTTATDDDHDTRMGLQSLVPPIQHEEVFVQDREIIRQTSVNSEIVAATSEISMSQYRMETILEESPAASVKEIQEEDETLAIKESEEEGSESSYEEQDEIREESSSSSSLESSTEAVWPAELIDDNEEKEESNQNVIMSTENTVAVKGSMRKTKTKTRTSDNKYASSSSHSKAITLLLLALILALGLLSLAHRASFTTITKQLRVTEF